MKKKWTMGLLAAFLLLLCGCSQEKVDGYVTQLGEKVIDSAQGLMDRRAEQKAMEEQEKTDQGEQEEQVPTPVETGLEVVDEAVIMTLDYQGLVQVHAFFYENGVLNSALVYMSCTEEMGLDTARLYFEQANAQQLTYTDVRTEGTAITAAYSAQELSRYQDCSMEQLCSRLAEEYGLELP